MSYLASPFVALVTGAGRGIGKETALRFAREPGCRLVLVDRDEAPLVELARRLSVSSSSIAVDLTDANAPKRIRDHVVAKHNRLDDGLRPRSAASPGASAAH